MHALVVCTACMRWLCVLRACAGCVYCVHALVVCTACVRWLCVLHYTTCRQWAWMGMDGWAWMGMHALVVCTTTPYNECAMPVYVLLACTACVRCNTICILTRVLHVLHGCPTCSTSCGMTRALPWRRHGVLPAVRPWTAACRNTWRSDAWYSRDTWSGARCMRTVGVWVGWGGGWGGKRERGRLGAGDQGLGGTWSGAGCTWAAGAAGADLWCACGSRKQVDVGWCPRRGVRWACRGVCP